MPAVSQIQELIVAGKSEEAQAKAADLAETARKASADTDGFVWRAMEVVPFVGQNLYAVRMATATVDEIARGAIVPASTLSLAQLTPVDGRIDTASISTLISTFHAIAGSVSEAEGLMASVDRGILVGPVSGGVKRIDDALERVSSLIGPAMPVVDALPSMLGQDGPRDVLVIFQNNGEVMPAGGTVGSLAQLHIEDGAVSVVAQSSASGRDMEQFAEPIVPIADDVRDLYPFGLGTHVQNATKTPRFDLTFEIAREMWRHKTGVTVDAVISMDTLALSYLLVATGPIPIFDGLEISNDNAVPLLLGDLYYDYEPAEVDLINQAFAGKTLQALMSGGADPAKLVSVIGLAVEEGRVRIWSSRESEQQLIAGTGVDKRGPAQTEKSDGIGVYFTDFTPGKMQRFMTQSVDVAQGDCQDGTRQVQVSVTIVNTVDAASVVGLPEYVTGTGDYTPKGSMQLETLVYAPAGYSLVASEVGGDIVGARTGTDGGMAVEAVRVVLAPGESRTIVLRYSADGSERPITADVTPVVKPTTLTDSVLACVAD
ncbi:hypothetical protein ASD93_09115 [Microbacterium sp. Root180]|nr:hypothetical protein ASD93_09115 [Microbacterium sp. Root180]